jgi:hypothetical protein
MMLERAPSGFSTGPLWRAASPAALARASSADNSGGISGTADIMMFNSPHRSPWATHASGPATSQPFTPFTPPGLPLDLPTHASAQATANPPTPANAAAWASTRQLQLAAAPSSSSLCSPIRGPQQQLGPAGTSSDTAAMLVSPYATGDTITSRRASLDSSPAAARIDPRTLATLARAESASLAMGMGGSGFGGPTASSQLLRAGSAPLAPPPGLLGSPARAPTPTAAPADLLGLPYGYSFHSPAASSAALDPLLMDPVAAAVAAAAGSPQPAGYSSPRQQLLQQDPLLSAAHAIQLATPRLYQQHQQLGPMMPAAEDALLASDPIQAEALRLLLAGVPPADLQAAGVDMDQLLLVYQRHLQMQQPAAAPLLQPPQSPVASLAAALGGPTGPAGQLSAYEDMLATALAARLNQMDEVTRCVAGSSGAPRTELHHGGGVCEWACTVVCWTVLYCGFR